jgi:hypothetical protein
MRKAGWFYFRRDPVKGKNPPGNAEEMNGPNPEK